MHLSNLPPIFLSSSMPNLKYNHEINEILRLGVGMPMETSGVIKGGDIAILIFDNQGIISFNAIQINVPPGRYAIPMALLAFVTCQVSKCRLEYFYLDDSLRDSLLKMVELRIYQKYGDKTICFMNGAAGEVEILSPSMPKHLYNLQYHETGNSIFHFESVNYQKAQELHEKLKKYLDIKDEISEIMFWSWQIIERRDIVIFTVKTRNNIELKRFLQENNIESFSIREEKEKIDITSVEEFIKQKEDYFSKKLEHINILVENGIMENTG